MPCFNTLSVSAICTKLPNFVPLQGKFKSGDTDFFIPKYVSLKEEKKTI